MPWCLQQYLRSFFCHITNFNAANSEMFRVNTLVTELLVLFHRGENKQAAEEIHPFPSLKLNKHEVVWKLHTTFLNRARDDSKRYAAFALKGTTDVRPLRRECGIARRNLNSRILSCWQCLSTCILHVVFYHKEKHLTPLLINLCMGFKQIGFVRKRIVPLG